MAYFIVPPIEKVCSVGPARVQYAGNALVSAERVFQVYPYHAFPRFLDYVLGRQPWAASSDSDPFEAPAAHPTLAGLYASDATVAMAHANANNQVGETPLNPPVPPSDANSQLAALVHNQRENIKGPAVVTVTYTQFDETSVNYQYGSRNLSSSNNEFFWANGKALSSTNTPISRTIATLDYLVTRAWVDRVPRAVVTALMGRINYFDYAFKVRHPWNQAAPTQTADVWPKETLYFDRIVAERKLTLRGRQMVEVQYGFQVMAHVDKCAVSNSDPVTLPVGWNRLYDPTDRLWRYVFSRGGELPTVPLVGDTSGIYRYAEALAMPQWSPSVQGFDLLFDSRSAELTQTQINNALDGVAT